MKFIALLAALFAVLFVAVPAYAACVTVQGTKSAESGEQPSPPPAQSLSPTTGGEEPYTYRVDSKTNNLCNP